MTSRRIWNPLLTVFSLIGGVIGFGVGEWLLSRYGGVLHETLLMGIYFGQLALWIGLGALLAETVSPKLNGHNWRLRYAPDGWKLLVPSTLLLLFAAGALFQWGYGFQPEKRQALRDYVLVLDISASMKRNDPGEESLHAAQSLIQRIDEGTRFGVLTFNEKFSWVQPITELRGEAAKQDLSARLGQAAKPSGETDIGRALTEAARGMQEAGTPAQRGTVILFSDGYSPMDVPSVTAPFVQNGFKIHTVGLEGADEEGGRLLQSIAAASGGTFQQVKSAELLNEAIGSLYTERKSTWHLVGDRPEGTAETLFLPILRIVLILLIGALLGLSLGIIFDNRFLARSFLAGGAVSGLLAGLLLEYGLPSSEPWLVRGEADLLLALLLSLSTVLFGVAQGSANVGLRGNRSRELPEPANDYGRSRPPGGGKQFR
ncbi:MULTISPECIES: vWA domain-containing protein [Paenibacillus]|uniref:vWA domain-containing protein n=1 Tax=Paenibacillus TaxID=44249 RepID=UPI0022B85A33|nr:vWA domain-containing protein [Paenibacillus caseinilyticus]MCZ8522584.1 VWA domain-containing protein [Paenibacillus caseinilyticus]